jgi:hypothetical protein
MRLATSTNIQDGWTWICSKRSCGNVKISIRKDSFFENSKASLKELCLFIYYWCKDYPSKQINEELNISLKTIVAGAS